MPIIDRLTKAGFDLLGDIKIIKDRHFPGVKLYDTGFFGA